MMSTYDELIQKSKDLDGVKERFKVGITPILAQEILNGRDLMEAAGRRQVDIDKNLLTKYTEAMRNDEWVYGIGSVSLALYRGQLVPVNGNHTLKAVVDSGKTQVMEVFLNTPLKEFVLYDGKGISRTLAEQLRTIHVYLTTPQAAILGGFLPKAVLAVTKNILGQDSTATVSDFTSTAFFEENKDDALEATNFVLVEKSNWRPQIALVYFLALRQGVLNGAVLDFLTELRDGVPSRRNSPGFRFLNKATRGGKYFKQANALKCIFYVVNRLLEGKKIEAVHEADPPLSIRIPVVRSKKVSPFRNLVAARKA